MFDFVIIGYQRSGTSLLRALLNKHPSIYIPPEASFATYFCDEYFELKKEELGKLVNLFIESRKFNNWNVGPSVVEEAFEKSIDYRSFVSNLYQAKKAKIKKEATLIGDKNNVNMLYINSLLKLNSNLKFVVIMRNPISVYHSLVSLVITESQYSPTKFKNQNEFLKDYKYRINFLERELKSIPKNNVKYLSFESLINNVNQEIKKIENFLGLEEAIIFDKNDSVTTIENFDEPTEYLKWKDSLLRSIDSRKITPFNQDFLRKLNLEDFKRIKNIQENMLTRGAHEQHVE